MSLNRSLIAKFIKEQRESFGWSQREFGRRLGCPQATVHQWESEKSAPDLASLDKIAALFGLRTWQLFKLIEDGEVSNPAKSSPWNDIQSFISAIDLMPREDVAKIVSAGAQKLVENA